MPTISGYVNTMAHSVSSPNCAPACEYVAMPDGSSSAAPVIRPGPSCRAQSRSLLFISLLHRRRGEYNPQRTTGTKKSPGSCRGFACKKQAGCVIESTSLPVGFDVAVLVVAQENCADHESHQCHDDRVPQAEVDVPLPCNERSRKQRQHAA